MMSMALRKDAMRRKNSLRMEGWDYGRAGAYSLTLCTWKRLPLFGRIDGGVCRLNAWGRTVFREWYRSRDLRSEIALDAFVVMPDHLHGIVWIKPGFDAGKDSPPGIPGFVRGFKGAVTRNIAATEGRNPTVWQRGYYDKIIRSSTQLRHCRRYIQQNPKNAGILNVYPG